MDKIRLNCADQVFLIDDLALSVTISTGITKVKAEDDEGSIVKRADTSYMRQKIVVGIALSSPYSLKTNQQGLY